MGPGCHGSSGRGSRYLGQRTLCGLGCGGGCSQASGRTPPGGPGPEEACRHGNRRHTASDWGKRQGVHRERVSVFRAGWAGGQTNTQTHTPSHRFLLCPRLGLGEPPESSDRERWNSGDSESSSSSWGQGDTRRLEQRL